MTVFGADRRSAASGHAPGGSLRPAGVGLAGVLLISLGIVAGLLSLSTAPQATTAGQFLLKWACAAMIVLGIRRHRPRHPGAWYLVAGYFVLSGIRNVRRLVLAWTDGSWSLLQGNLFDLTFSVLSGVALLAGALTVLRRRRRRAGDWAMADVAVLAVGAGLAAMVMISIPLLQSSGLSVPFWAVAVVAVVRDVGTLTVAVALLCSERIRSWSHGAFAVGLAVLGTASLVWIRGASFAEFPPWALGIAMAALTGAQVLLGFSALHPSMGCTAEAGDLSRPPWTSARTVVLVTAVLLPVLAVLRWSELTRGQFVLVMVGFAALLVTIVWRLRHAVLVSDRLVRDVQFLADHDQLTELPNRRHLYGVYLDGLRAEVAVRGEITLSACYLDLDDLREINDRFDHEGGDRVLTAVATALREDLDPRSTVIRVGGDEFVVLTRLRGADPEMQAERAATDVAGAVERLGIQPTGRTQASIGWSWRQFGGTEATLGRQLDSLIHEADLAQAVSKRSGGGRVTAYESSIGAVSRRRTVIRQELPPALHRRELGLVYQPVVALDDRVPMGVECLLRWTSPVLGAVPPPDAVSAAEDLGLIEELGSAVLERAVADLQAAAPDPALRIGLNLSAHQLRPGTVDRLITQLVDTGLADRVWLEVTEQLLVEERRHAAGALADLRSVGVLVAIDDFGTGYCGLDYLCTLPVDLVKLDGGFAREIEHSQARMRVARLAVQLAEAVGARTVAEGLESERTAEVMRGLGFTFGQGFALGRPVSDLSRAVGDRPGPRRPEVIARRFGRRGVI